MRITGLSATAFPPFGDINLTFPQQSRKGTEEDSIAEVHLFTGENGTGKTRLLAVLAAALGNNRALQKRHGIQPERLLVFSETREGTKRQWDCATNNPQTPGRLMFEAGCYAYSGHIALQAHTLTPLARVEPPPLEELIDFDRAGDGGKLISQCLYNFALQAASEAFDNPVSGKQSSRWRRLLDNVQRCVSDVTGSQVTFRPETFPKPC